MRTRDLESFYDSKETKRGVYVLGMLKSGKKVILLNGEIEQIFSGYEEAHTMFEIFTRR